MLRASKPLVISAQPASRTAQARYRRRTTSPNKKTASPAPGLDTHPQDSLQLVHSLYTARFHIYDIKHKNPGSLRNLTSEASHVKAPLLPLPSSFSSHESREPRPSLRIRVFDPIVYASLSQRLCHVYMTFQEHEKKRMPNSTAETQRTPTLEALPEVVLHTTEAGLETAESTETVQSGRSSTSLHAERAAAALRERDAPSPDRPASAPETLRIEETGTGHQTIPGSSSSLSLPIPPQNSSPNLLSVSHSFSSFSAASSSHSLPDFADRPPALDGLSASPGEQPRHAGASRRLIPPRSPVPRPQHRSAPELGGTCAALTLRDLGSDYTRYPNRSSIGVNSSVANNLTTRSSKRPSFFPTTPSFSSLLPTNPFLTPDASTVKLDSTCSDTEKYAFLIDDRLIAPYEQYTSDKEDDDYMHEVQEDDHIRYKTKWKDHFSKGNIASTIGLFGMILGLLFLFIVLPIISYTGIIDWTSPYSTPLDQMPQAYPKPEPWATVNNRTYPLLRNMRSGLIDPDTPDHAKTKTGANGDEFELVFSDEFNINNRTFYEGDDPYWFAPDIWYGATQDLEWYDPDAATTWDGVLELRLDRFKNHGLDFRSGMLNSWNQLCFKGGIFEVSMSLPGPAGIMGLWPGVWTLGNLGRPGYLATTDGLWPYTYQACDVGITPNQSSYDGLSRLPGMRLPSCTCSGEDHPTPGKGRGAPEIDIAEVGASWPPASLPIATQSLQVAPFDIWWYPDYEFTAFPDYRLSYPNGWTGGPYQQALSATTNLNKQWFDGKAYQRYSFEYVPGEGEDAYVVWKVGNQTMFMMDGRAIGPNGNIQARQISEEPMSLVLNLGFSSAWTWIDWDHLVFPTVMRVDYVRWYQRKGQHMVTCDPPGWETTQYIKDHINAYTNPNFTVSHHRLCAETPLTMSRNGIKRVMLGQNTSSTAIAKRSLTLEQRTTLSSPQTIHHSRNCASRRACNRYAFCRSPQYVSNIFTSAAYHVSMIAMAFPNPEFLILFLFKKTTRIMLY